MAAEMVMVGCKLPGGLHLDLFDAQGSRTSRITLKGNAENLDPAESNIAYLRARGGYAFTPVSKEHWDEWEKMMRQAKFAPLLNNQIIVQPTEARLISEATEKASVAAVAPRASIDDPAYATTRGRDKVSAADRKEA